MQVKDIMTREPVTISSTKSISSAARLMRDMRIGCLPSMMDDKLIGLLTDRDIVTRVVAENFDPNEHFVSDHMTKDLVVISPETMVEDASRLMAEKRIRRLPVMKEGQLVGMVSIGDIARAEEKTLAGETIQLISEPTIEERKVA